MKDRLRSCGVEPTAIESEISGVFLRRQDGSLLHCDDYSSGFFEIHADASGVSLSDVIKPSLRPYFEALDEVCLDQGFGVLDLGPSEGVSGFFRVTQEQLPDSNGGVVLLGRVRGLESSHRASQSGHWDWDILEDKLLWSGDAEDILGLDSSEVSGFRQYLDRVHVADRRHVLAAISACLYRNQPFRLEHRIVLRSGDVKTVRVSAQMDRGRDGRPRRMLGTLRTQTAGVSSCNELSRCPGLIDHLPEAVFWVDPTDHSILDLNKLACLYLDASRQHLLSSDFSAVLDSKEWAFQASVPGQRHIASVRLFECNLLRGDGHKMPVEVNAKLIQHEGEDRVLAVVRNISVRRDLQELLRTSEEFKSDLLLDLPQLIARWTSQGTLEYANEAFCKAFNSSLDDLQGRAMRDFIWESELPSLENTLQQVVTPDEIREVELRDGGDPDSNRWYRWRIRGLRESGSGRLGYQTIATEIAPQTARASRASVGNERLRFAFQTENDQPALVGQKRFQSQQRALEDLKGPGNERPQKSLSDLDRLLHDEDRQALNLRLAERYQRTSVASLPVKSGPAKNHTVEKPSDNRHLSLFQHAPEALIVHTLEGEIVEANIRACELLGLAEAKLVKASILGLPDRRELLAFRLALEELRADGRVQFESRIRVVKSRLMPVEISSCLISMADGMVAQTMIRDITDRKVREERVELSAKVFENTNEAVLITDSDGKIVTVNKAFSRIYKYTAHEVKGSNPRILNSGKQNEAFYKEMWQALKENGFWQGELWNRRKSGEEIPVWESINAVKDADGRVTHYIAVVADISTLKQAQDDNNYLAYHDPLTDLPNRLLFNEQVMHALLHCKRSQSRLAVMFMDLDRFKNINDTFGHPVGDEVLRLVSQRIREVLRDEDVIARIGGDEFIMLLEHINDASDGGVVARKILDCFLKPFTVSGKELYLSASIGISVYPEDGADVSSLVKNADTAMYQAKARGRNDYRFYTEELTIDPSEHLFIETGLRQALGRGELDVYYQPQIALDTGRIVGAEALLRWRHPEKGLMTPEYFIPLAEETGLIVPIGQWVLSEACAQAKRWHEEGYPLRRISVNLSTIQVQRGDIVSTVAQVLRRTGLSPEFLELEITENFILEDSDQSMSVLQGLRDLGVQLAIDDFGTGYSNLSYLKRLPVSKLKIDKSFVRDMHNDPNDEDIVRAVIALAKSLHLRLVAEGIEQEAQLQFLMAEGCHEGQGFLYSPPVPAEEFPALYRRFCGAELNLYPLDSKAH